MKQIIVLQELAISLIVAERQNSNPLILGSLKERGIVPEDWILSRPIVSVEQVNQIAFTNGISLIIRPDSTTFLEPLRIDSSERVRVAKVACSYAENFPEANYLEVIIDIRSFVAFECNSDRAAYDYIKTLLSPHKWLESNQDPVKINISLTYNLEQRQLILSISETILELPSNQAISAVLFSGRFSYKIKGTTTLNKLENLKKIISCLEEDLESYREIVDKNFFRT